ncbi:GNAT family N-acetyltransferase [Hoeflea ulvae]|uniref:GNAT family N-acetyltransferase n=1 Tax=Hoeflea ulvae TaxID=2983764 RepID=A0ABT3YGK1_9HYPH|nr:GNAT family N-acetyltransferase [Hoeflea ulvae]MCY0095030.1 GNAT family N-acetyltransferase [Hoeflea ulvae]
MHIRPATRADSADIVILDDIASSGLATRVLEAGVREGCYDRPLEFGRDGYAFIDGPFSWKNVLIAETGDGVAGMSLSFELTGGPGDQGLPDPVLEPLETLKSRAIGSRFIDSVAVYTRFRGQGIGRALLRAELDRAAGPSSIITDDANSRALSLYQSFGFEEQGRAPIIAFSDTHTATQWVLLTRPAANAHGAPASAQ